MPRRSAKSDTTSPLIAAFVEELRRQGRYSVEDIAEAFAERLYAWLPGREELRRRLTKRQAMRLMTDSGLDSAVRLNADLPADALAASIVLPNARLLISELMTCGGAKFTEAGFLNRRFVMKIGGKFDWPGYDWAAHWTVSKTVREAEVTPLWFLHGVFKFAGLVYVRRGVLHAGKRGRELTAPGQAGALQATLFRAAWRDFDLAGLGGIGLGRRLQQQQNLILYMIGRLAEDWIDSERLLRAAVLPDEEILAAPEYLPRYALEGCILRPLEWFGLIERRALPAETGWRSRRELRKTPLFDRFLGFDPGPA